MQHKGGCHCGAVRFQVDLNLETVLECNCSICSKKASLLAFAPASQFELISGEDSVTDYVFNKEIIHHLFCKICGIHSFARGTAPDGTAMAAINVRCLDDIDIASLKITQHNGRDK